VYDFLFVIIELFSLALTVEALQGKKCQDSLVSAGGRSIGTKISGRRGHPWGIYFGFYKTRHILLSDSANCTVLCAVVLTQYRRVSDEQTDGIAVASTGLAMRALRCAVKILDVEKSLSVSLAEANGQYSRGSSLLVNMASSGWFLWACSLKRGEFHRLIVTIRVSTV